MPFGIGKIAKLAGVKIPTIRYYEQCDLIPAPRRNAGGQRRYDVSSLNRLHFILHARQLGFSVDDIRQLLAMTDQPSNSCVPALEVARHHLRDVEDKISRLRLMASELQRMIDGCCGGSNADCSILKTISCKPAREG